MVQEVAEFRRGNRCAQIFATDFGRSCLFLMKQKNRANETLSLLFQLDVVPPTVICDNAKEMDLGEFNWKLNHLKQMEPFTPLMNAAKKIKELKRGSGRKLIKSSTPKRLWDDCLELESYIRSNTVHSIYKLDGEVPDVSGAMSNISQFCEFEWFEWLMFHDKIVPYPNDHFRRCRYLSLSIDINPTLMAKFIKENSQVLHWLTNQALTSKPYIVHSWSPYTRGWVTALS